MGKATIHGGATIAGAGQAPEGGILLRGKRILIRDGAVEFRDESGSTPDLVLTRSASGVLYLPGTLAATTVTATTVTGTTVAATTGNITTVNATTVAASGQVTGTNLATDYVRTTNATAINNSDVLVSDDVMTASLGIGSYLAEGMLLYNANQSADMKVRFNTTGTMTAIGTGFSLTGTATTSGTGTVSSLQRANNSDFTVGAADSGGNLNLSMAFRLYINVTVAGVFTIQYAQATAHASDLVVMAGSVLSIRKIRTP